MIRRLKSEVTEKTEELDVALSMRVAFQVEAKQAVASEVGQVKKRMTALQSELQTKVWPAALVHFRRHACWWVW